MKNENALFKRFAGVEGKRRCMEALKDQIIVQGSEPIARALCKKRTLQFYKEGDVIIKQGDGTTDIAFILAGRVAAVRNNREFAHRPAGHGVGEMAAIDVQKKRCASIVTEDASIDPIVVSGEIAAVLARLE